MKKEKTSICQETNKISTFCFMISMDCARNLPHVLNWDIKKEGFLCLLRTSQHLFVDGISKLSDSSARNQMQESSFAGGKVLTISRFSIIDGRIFNSHFRYDFTLPEDHVRAWFWV